MEEVLELRKKRDFNQIIGDSFTFLKRYWKPLFRVSLIISGPVLVVGGILLALGFGNILTMIRYNNDISSAVPSILLMSIGFFFFAAAISMFGVMVYSFMRYLADNNNAIPSTGQIWELTRRKYFQVLGVTFVSFIIATVGYFGVNLLFSLSGNVLLMFLGMLVSSVASVFLVTKIILAPAAIVLDDRSFGKSIERSWTYTTDNFWATFGTIAIPYLINNFISLFFNIPFFILISVFFEMHKLGGSNSSQLASVLLSVAGVLSIFVQMILTILPISAIGMQYLNLSERNEGFGLLNKIQQMDLGTTSSQNMTNEEMY